MSLSLSQFQAMARKAQAHLDPSDYVTNLGLVGRLHRSRPVCMQILLA